MAKNVAQSSPRDMELWISNLVKYKKSNPEKQKLKQFSAQSSHEPGGQQGGLLTKYFHKRWRAGGRVLFEKYIKL